MGLLRLFDRRVFDAIQPYRVADDALMPWAYQRANPAGRPLHDDWALFKSTPRISTAYRVPLPFRGSPSVGAFEQRWMLWDENYPASPGLQIEMRSVYDGKRDQILPHALVDCAIEGSGLAEFEAYINDEWVPVFKSYRRVICGKLVAWYSGGLKQDLTVSFDEQYRPKSDLMGWWDPPSLSLNKTLIFSSNRL